MANYLDGILGGKHNSDDSIASFFPKKIYQPKLNESGKIIGHESEEPPFSFEVWRKKENLISEYPNCIILSYNKGDIEEPTYRD